MKFAVLAALMAIAVPAPALAAPLQSAGVLPPTKLTCNGFFKGVGTEGKDYPVGDIFLEISKNYVNVITSWTGTNLNQPERYEIVIEDELKIIFQSKLKNITGNINRLDGNFLFSEKVTNSDIVINRFKGHCQLYRPMF